MTGRGSLLLLSDNEESWSSAKKCVRLQSRCDSAARDVARNEADAGVVGDHQVAGRDPNLPDLHGAVHLPWSRSATCR
jgi:hypothetical protein